MPLYQMSAEGDKNHLDYVTRQRMTGNDEWKVEDSGQLLDKVTTVAFVLGFILGVIVAEPIISLLIWMVGL